MVIRERATETNQQNRCSVERMIAVEVDEESTGSTLSYEYISIVLFCILSVSVIFARRHVKTRDVITINTTRPLVILGSATSPPVCT